MKRRDFVATIGLGAASLTLTGCLKERRGSGRAERPNILFIMADDHASHALGCYGGRLPTPHIDRIAGQGVRFSRCFCTDGICAPSRAVILTGKHSHVNGIRDNSTAFDGTRPTFPKILQAAGYRTALIGKWHLKSDPTGFDRWIILPGQGDYYNPELIEMGKIERHEGYVTDILTDLALDFLRESKNSDHPFLMMLHHKAPHRNWQPALRHLKLFDGVEIPEPATLFDGWETRSRAAAEQEMTLRSHLSLDSDLKMGAPPERMNEAQKESWEQVFGPRRAIFEADRPAGDDLVRWKYRRFMEDYLGCIAAVDEGVGRILDELDEAGLARNTVVVYTSDQGFFLGDHGWFDKRFMYEEALRMPLVIRYPPLVAPGAVIESLVSNLDLAPTFLDLAGAAVPPDMQGRSFLPLLEGEPVRDWRRAVYYHYYEYPAVHMVKRHYGIRTPRFKLIHFYHDIDAWELYDLENDPREMVNVYDDAAYSETIDELKAELERLRRQTGDSDELARRMLESDLKRWAR